MEFPGWSAAEQAHARRVLGEAEAAKHPHVRRTEHVHFWVLVVTMLFGNLCFTLLMFPLLLFTTLWVSIPIMLMLGACAGLLFALALHSLRTERHIVGFSFLLIASAIAMTFTVNALQQRFRIVPGIHQYNAFLLVLPFIIGMTIPYLNRRLHGSA